MKTATSKLFTVTCPCGELIHVGADAVEHVAEMGRTIRDWENINKGKNAYIVELEREVEELRARLRDTEEVRPPESFTIPCPVGQMGLL